MAHGLVLRMHEMVGFRSEQVPNEKGIAYAEYNANPSTSDASLPRLWIEAVEFKSNLKADYLTLLRRTLLFMFSSKWSVYSDKGDLLCAINYYYSTFKKTTENFSEVHNEVLEIFRRDPWKNPFFLWNDLFDGTVTIYDKRVQDYFESEPEEIVLARVHALVLRNRARDAMCLAKTSFLYHSRIAKSFRSSRRRNSTSGFSTSGHASIDWFLFILQKIKRSLNSIVNEIRQLECHEGVEILYRLWRDQKNKPFCYTLLKIFLLQDLIQTSKYCCTKRLFKIFCMMHEELHSSPKEIAESCLKLISKHAPSSAHFYLLVDVLWRQFGMKCLDLYVDLYVRGLTADINHLENKRHLGAFLDAESLETHIAVIFVKLSTMFKNLNPSVARECMFSAFSLRPTKERLFMLQILTQSLSNSNKNIHKSLLAFDFSTDCNCGLRCIGHCRDALNKSSFIHPLLSNSIGNISHVVKRDFISVLENVRCVTFQYNVFDWRCNISDLGSYLSSYSRESTLQKSGSDTESGDEICDSSIGKAKTAFETADDLECRFQCSSIKRKSASDFSHEINPLNIRENSTVQDDDFFNKKMKTAKPNMEMSVTVSSNNQQVIQGIFNNSLENVIRMSLNNNPAKSWSDSLNLLKVNKEPVINDPSSSKVGRTENSFQSCVSERNADHHPNHQRCLENKGNFSLHYSDKTHLQISATLQYDHTQPRIAVAPENNTSFEEIGSSEHQNILKLHLAQKSSTVSDFTTSQPISETFSNNIIRPKHERRSSQEMTNLHFAAKSDRERHVHHHHLHSSPFVSSQPPPKSFSKNQVKSHPLAEAKTQIVSTLEARESVSCDNTRKSVIVNVKGKSLQIANQLPFSVKQNAIPQNGNNFQKDGSALQLLHVNVPNKYLPKPEIPVNASLIIPYKFDGSVSSSASQISANNDKNESVVPELIVPGIMAPASMIKNNPWKTSVHNHAKTFFPDKISDGTPFSGLPKVSSKSGQAQSLLLKPGSDVALKRNASRESEFGTVISKPVKDFKEFNKNNLHHTVTNKGMTYSNSQQLDNSLDSKLKWKMGQTCDSTRSQMTFHPISDSNNAPVSTNSQPWYASPHSKTNSNSPLSFSAHKMNIPKTSSNSPVSFSSHKMNTSLSYSSSSVHKMGTPLTNSNSPVSFSVHNMNTSQINSNSPVPSSVYKKNSPQMGSNSPVSFSVQHMRIPKTISSSPVSFSVQNMKNIESFGDKKISTHTDANSHNYSSGDNVQNKPSVSFLKSRLTSVHNTQSYSHINAYSYPKSNSFSAHDKAYSENHESSQHQFDVKNIFERSTHSFISSANISSNSISSTQIQSNSSSVHNPVYSANDRRVIVHETRSIATSSPTSNVQNIKGNAFSQQCCSPFEVNPCDTCSTKTSNQCLTKNQVIDFHSSPDLHNQVTDGISSDDKCFEVPQRMQQQTENEEPQKKCIFCSFLFPASLMKTHVENTHQEELLNVTNYNIQNQILNKETSFSVSNSEGIGVTNYDSQKENHLSLENNIHSACNTALDIENSQNTDQFISSLLDFIGPNFDKSIEGSFENAVNSHPINTNESPCDNSKSESLSEMLQEVDFSRNISSDLSVICDGNELSYDIVENKQSNGEIVRNENKDIKSWYNNLNLDLLSSDDKVENEMVGFKILDYKPQSSEISHATVTNNGIDLGGKQTSESLKNSYEMFRTVEPLVQSDLVQNIQELDKTGNFQNNSSQPLKKSLIFCSICKRKLEFDVDIQQHIDIYHPHINGDKTVFNLLNLSNNSETEEANEPKINFTPCSFNKQGNATEIFDFNSYSPDSAAQEVYKPLQKGKAKLYSNSSCNSESSLNIHEKFNAEETEDEILTSKKKGPRMACEMCNKVYSKNYLKTHYRKEHMQDLSICFKMSENSSNQSLSGQTAISSSTPEQNQNFSGISAPMLQEDIDTRTCLSASDALNSSSKFEGSNIKKRYCEISNRMVQLEQEHLFHSVSDGVKESSVDNVNFEVVEKPSFTVLKEKEGFNSKPRNAINSKPKRTKRYQCNWGQNQNYCNQNFSSKLLLLKHLKTEHFLKNECNWFQNNNWCNQKFPSESLLIKHLRSEHMIKRTFECDIQLRMDRPNVSTLEKGQKMKENTLFYNYTNNKGSVFIHEDLQETRVLKPKSDLPTMNSNHKCTKVVNNMKSVMQLSSDKAISFSQNEHVLPSEQVCPEDVDNPLYNEIYKKDGSKCHPSTKPVCHYLSNSLVDKSDMLSPVEEMSPKQYDTSNLIRKSCEKTLIGNELPDLYNSFEENTHAVNAYCTPQKIHEKNDKVLSYKCDWFQNNNVCNQKFPSKSLLLKHLRCEHLKEKSFECDIQQNVTQKNDFDRNLKIKENRLFYSSTNTEGSVLVHEDLQENRVLKHNSDPPSGNLNHECIKVENNVNSFENALPSKQVSPEDLNNQLYNKNSEKDDSNCHLSPKLVSHILSDSLVDENDIFSSKQKSNSVREGCENSLHKDELSVLLNSFKESFHENSLPQKMYERFGDFSFVSDTKRNSQNDINSVQNSDLNANPSDSDDFATLDIDSDNGILSVTSNSVSKSRNMISELLPDFEERNMYLKSKESNKYEKLEAQSDCKIIEDEKIELVDAAKFSNPYKFSSISSKKLGSQALVKKPVEICDTSLFKNTHFNFGRKLINTDPLKCLASSASQLSCNKELHATNSFPNKQAVTNSDCASVKQQAGQDNKSQGMSHKRINSLADNNVSASKGKKLCKKNSKGKNYGELFLNFEKPATHINNCTRLADLEMQVSSSPENLNNQTVQNSLTVQNCQYIENGLNSLVNCCTELIQKADQLNSTQIAKVVDKPSAAALPKNDQFDSSASNFTINNSEDCPNNSNELKANVDLQTQSAETYKVNESMSANNVIDQKQYVKSNGPASSMNKISNTLPNSSLSLSGSDEKGMPNLVPEFDFHSLLVNEKFKTDENTLESEKDLKRPGFYCFPYEISTTSDVSCPTYKVIAVSSTGTHTVNNQEPFCVSSISSCSYPKVLTIKDSKDNGNLNYLNEEYSVFSSVDTLQDLSINEIGLLESVMKSKSNNVSMEHSNDSTCNQKENSVVKSDTVNSFPIVDFGKNCISSDKDIASCGESMDSEKSVDNQLSERKQLTDSCALLNEISSFQGHSFEQEIKETVDDMVSYIISCENRAYLNFENYTRNQCDETRMIATVTESETSSDSVLVNFDCGENNLRARDQYKKRIFVVPYETSNVKTGENSSVVCRECNKVFQSDEVLSDHLELIHHLPHLKKQISECRKKSNVDKLSPPPLYSSFEQNENSVYDYDSTSVSAESSSNKYSEEDNCISYKNTELEEFSSAESEPSLSESWSNIYLEEIKSSKSIQSSSLVSQLSSNLKCKKGPNVTQSRHQNEKHKMATALSSHKRKIRKYFNKNPAPFNALSGPLNKDLICKNAALPKCIIKVLKDEQNSVFYKIDNPPDIMSENFVETKCNSYDNPKYTDTNSNTALLEHQFFESSIKYKQDGNHPKSKKRSKMSFDPYSPGTSSNSVLSTESKELCEEADKNVFFLLNNIKRTKQKINTIITLKSKDIDQFLINNKQPHVLVTRLDDSFIKSSNVSALKPDFSYINFIRKRSVVRVKRLSLPADLYKNKVHLSGVSVVVPRLPNDVEEKALETSSILSSLKDCFVMINRIQ